jgi:hypothetical protein
MTLDALLTLDPQERQRRLARLDDQQRLVLATALKDRISNPWVKYADDPVRFVTEGLKEGVWSKQVEILQSVRDNKRTAVPACHAPGKTHIAARVIAWWVVCHPQGTSRVVTTATIFRQVKNILWPHIRRVHSLHNLPGEVLTTEWKVGEEVVADGFSAADHNETAVQGIHAEHLLVVVDEAGGISPTIGQALESLMTGGHTRLLVLGNPPTDNIGGWFEQACNSPLYNVIPIPATATPNFTGEHVGRWAKNLVDQQWVKDVTSEFGEQSPFVQARVYARFPRVTTNVTIPVDWIESALTNEPGTGPIRLGVDVAADGGDEFAIAQVAGNTVSIIHTSTNNSNAVEVAGTVLNCIHQAQQTHQQLQITQPIQVNIDAIGVGWGVASLLQEWAKEGRHQATINAVNVATKADETSKFANQRAEMWWATRTLLQPDPTTGEQAIRLNIDTRTIAQLTAPTYRANSTGRIQIEAKADMKKRGISSPDRAEALLLAIYQPPAHEVPVVAPLSIGQINTWKTI